MKITSIEMLKKIVNRSIDNMPINPMIGIAGNELHLESGLYDNEEYIYLARLENISCFLSECCIDYGDEDEYGITNIINELLSVN